jgi:hypothetical protein
MLGFLLSGMSAVLTKIPGLASKLIDYEVAKQNTAVQTHNTDVAADTQVNLAVLQNKLETDKLIAAQRAADRLSPWTEWMLPALFAVCLYHFGAIALDSVPSFGHVVGSWRVAALPDAQASIETSVLLGAAGVTVAVPAIRRIFSK